MLQLRGLYSLKRLSRVLAICLTLAGFCVSTVGVPVPVAGVSQEDGQRFMCEGHGCGCRTAQQCWSSCCCFSKAERLAWAARQDVDVSVDLSSSSDRHDEPEADRSQRYEVVSQTSSAVQRCCSHKAESDAAHKSCADASELPDARPTVEWYSSLAAQKCRGAAGTVMLLGDPLDAPPSLVEFVLADCSERLMEFRTPRLVSQCWMPPVPPG